MMDVEPWMMDAIPRPISESIWCLFVSFGVCFGVRFGVRLGSIWCPIGVHVGSMWAARPQSELVTPRGSNLTPRGPILEPHVGPMLAGPMLVGLMLGAVGSVGSFLAVLGTIWKRN